jgi:hypothetical protein
MVNRFLGSMFRMLKGLAALTLIAFVLFVAVFGPSVGDPGYTADGRYDYSAEYEDDFRYWQARLGP